MSYIENKLAYVIPPFFPIDSGVQLLSIMFGQPSGFANVSGVLPSGEANFLDFSQVELVINKGTNPATTPDTFSGTTHYSQSIVAPYNLGYYWSKQHIKNAPYYTDSTVVDTQTGELDGIFIQALSNGSGSRDYSINDFNIFNPYVHYDHSGITAPAQNLIAAQVTEPYAYAFTFNPSGFIMLGTQRFNLYSTQYRT
jgi:hypothetical protein